MECHNCGLSNPDERKYCTKCGQEIWRYKESNKLSNFTILALIGFLIVIVVELYQLDRKLAGLIADVNWKAYLSASVYLLIGVIFIVALYLLFRFFHPRTIRYSLRELEAKGRLEKERQSITSTPLSVPKDMHTINQKSAKAKDTKKVVEDDEFENDEREEDDLVDAIKKTFQDGEEIVQTYHMSSYMYLMDMIFFIIMGPLLIGALALTKFIYVGFISAFIFGLKLFWKVIVQQNTIYVISNYRIIKYFKIFSVDLVEIPYKKINQVNLRQGLIERMFGLGTIEIQSGAYGSLSTPEMTLEFIECPFEVKKVLSKYVR